MFRVVLVSVVLSLLILGNVFDVKADDKTEEAKPDKKEPAKVYDLKPKYTENMSWKEEINLKSVMYYSFGGTENSKTESLTMKLNTQLSNFKNYLPTKVKYSDCNGDLTVTRKSGENDEYTFESEITKGMVEADVSTDLTLKVTNNEKFNNDIIMIFPGSLLSWFVAPVRPVKVGDTWSSEELPIYKSSFETESNKFEDIKGEFKFEKVSEKDDVEFAHILWTGTSKLSKYKSRGPYDVSWNVKIVFDLTNRHVISSDGEAAAVLASGDPGGLKLTMNKKAIYDKKKESKDEAPIKPKTEDDE